jgi:hypothetical protein
MADSESWSYPIYHAISPDIVPRFSGFLEFYASCQIAAHGRFGILVISNLSCHITRHSTAVFGIFRILRILANRGDTAAIPQLQKTRASKNSNTEFKRAQIRNWPFDRQKNNHSRRAADYTRNARKPVSGLKKTPIPDYIRHGSGFGTSMRIAYPLRLRYCAYRYIMCVFLPCRCFVRSIPVIKSYYY